MTPNGFKQQPQGKAKDKFRAIETEMKNSQMAQRIQQMMVQQMIQNGQSMGQDISKLFQLFNELQYKFLALQEVTGADTAKLAEVAQRLRLKDFEEASAKEDETQGFTVGDVVTDDSTVILTSNAGQDEGIFRSRVKLADTGSPQLIQALTGARVGAKVKVMLNDVEHEVELLGIRQPAVVVEATPVEPLKAVEG